MSIADAVQRETALDPLRSFCVSAPAGSGKTELLIQRFLGLLSRVQRPEQVLAITFTRKAAAEMRERVLDALQAAQRGDPIDTPHQLRTRSLAEQALKVDQERGWQLTADINRFNIRTIDGFCSSLTRQMPILSDFGGQASVTDDADSLYAEAVHALFEVLDTDKPVAEDLKAVLSHFDNNWQRVQELLLAMLARRDQWRDYIGVRHDPEAAEQLLLDTVENAVAEELEQLHQALSGKAEPLLQLQRYAADQLGGVALQHFPGTRPEDLPGWRAMRDLLLTKQGDWRKTVDKRAGFPAGSADAKERKAQLLSLIEDMRHDQELRDALDAVTSLPQIGSGEKGWQLALHLTHILPRLAAELLLVFAARGTVDHSQVALSALQALGEDDEPTELAMRLDYQIEHILVDEFQDTAITQYDLVRRLTRGWGNHNAVNPDAPRTILIVGDGMQSIYGFRDANVGLFLSAREEGFNGVVPEHLELLCNFRSDEGVVEWVNETFAWAFPREDDIRRGQVRFTEAVPVKPAQLTPAVVSHGFDGEYSRDHEVAYICERILAGMADESCRSIAVLGRSRSQLQGLLDGFKRNGIAYSAQDMDTLSSSPAVIDLMTLCRALANVADEVAWLALLRAPWVGLSLSDLLALRSKKASAPIQPVYMAWRDEQLMPALSGDGALRLERLRSTLDWAEQKRERLALRVWVEQIWQALGGPATLTESTHLQEAERFFLLLEEADNLGQGLDIAWLNGQLARLKMSSEQPDSKVQVMTLHKAKGLEFDWVFIPGLDRATRGDDRAVMLWDDYTSASGERGFLLAADDRSDSDAPGLYNYLQRQRKLKGRLENTRLLYVGATRAVQHLVLSASVKRDQRSGDMRSPGTNTLLKPIWRGFEEQMQVHDAELPAITGQAEHEAGFYRLASTQPLPTLPLVESQPAGNIPRRVLNRLERHVGTVVHQLLEQLSLCAELPEQVGEQQRPLISHQLRALGLHGDILAQAESAVTAALNTTLACPRGRWILSQDHDEAYSEWALTSVADDGQLGDLIIDRSFIDRDTRIRWIVDYKTSKPAPDESLAQFVARESASYAAQLSAYRAALGQLDSEDLRCALYFCATATFHELAATA
jgi:ATP-dependent helicase/nuclease subunit A